jgi:cytochrome c-type biogenesis protein CcmH/NrfG
MGKEEKEEKKIIIDEEWKKEAQKEKEVLAAKEEAGKEKEGKTRRGSLPKGNLAALISMLVTQALFAMGALKMEGQEKEPDMEMARYHIDMLETLAEKTKGNLSKEEQKVLDNTLYEVRMAYVRMTGEAGGQKKPETKN